MKYFNETYEKILKKYKIEGVLTEKEDADYRISIQA